MSDPIKFTDEETKDLKYIQNKFQEKLIKFGQIHLETIELQERLDVLKQEQEKLKEKVERIRNSTLNLRRD